MLSLLPRWLWEFQIGEETRIKQLGPWLLFRIHQKCLLCTIPPQFLEKLEISSLTHLDLLVQEDTQA